MNHPSSNRPRVQASTEIRPMDPLGAQFLPCLLYVKRHLVVVENGRRRSHQRHRVFAWGRDLPSTCLLSFCVFALCSPVCKSAAHAFLSPSLGLFPLRQAVAWQAALGQKYCSTICRPRHALGGALGQGARLQRHCATVKL